MCQVVCPKCFGCIILRTAFEIAVITLTLQMQKLRSEVNLASNWHIRSSSSNHLTPKPTLLIFTCLSVTVPCHHPLFFSEKINNHHHNGGADNHKTECHTYPWVLQAEPSIPTLLP